MSDLEVSRKIQALENTLTWRAALKDSCFVFLSGLIIGGGIGLIAEGNPLRGFELSQRIGLLTLLMRAVSNYLELSHIRSVKPRD